MIPRIRKMSFPVSLIAALVILYGTLMGNTGASSGSEAKATPAPASVYHYNPIKKPDPFRSFLDREMAAQKQMMAKLGPIPMSPLQRAPVDQYKLKGIGGDERRRSAIVQDASGKFYPVFKGTIIGQNNGKVAEILRDRVIVEEVVKASRGQSKVNRITMKFNKESEEKP